MVDIRWVWLFLHHEDGDGGAHSIEGDRAWEFWTRVTASALSPRRGERGEFATLLPGEGDAWVKLQRTGRGDGIHVDLVVEDVDEAVAEATGLGAELADSSDGVRVMRSPGGFGFCFTGWVEDGPSRQLREGHATLLDQACLDIPAARYDDEVTFWAQLTGWELVPDDEPEFSSLRRPDGIPVRFLFQRLDDAATSVSGHPDVSCVDRGPAVEEWSAQGAVVVAEHEHWTVMRDPAGLVLCLTDRHPEADPGTRSS